MPGFSGLRQSYTIVYLNRGYRFSPVAGIQWVETILGVSAGREFTESFSPVAGIQWVETFPGWGGGWEWKGFSPVAGIQWVETTPYPVTLKY